MLTLYGCPNTRSIRAAWVLEEAGAEYAYEKIDLFRGEGRQPSFLRVNPGGKVPALADGEFVLTESAAICTYVGDRFPTSRLVPPAGTQARGRYDQWCYFVMSELEQPLWTMAKHRFVLPEAWRVPAVIDTAKKEFAVAVAILETGLGEGPFMFGETFTAADILVAHTLAWADKAQVPPESERLLAYKERALARPALARARQREAAG